MRETIPYQFLMDNLFDGVFVVDRQLRIAYWNRAMRELTGFGVSEALGKRCLDGLLLCVDERGASLCERGCPLRATLASARKCEARTFLRHRDGHRFPAQVRIGPIRGADGQTVGAIQVVQRASTARGMSERISGLEQLALIDRQTELPNRRYLLKALSTRLSEYRRYGWRIGLLLMRLDGIDGADPDAPETIELLRMAAGTLSACSRASDVIGRWDALRFAALVRNVDLDELVSVGERLRAMVEALRPTADVASEPLTASIGAAVARPGDRGETLAARAEEALEAAAEDGGNRVSVSLEMRMVEADEESAE